MNEDGPAFPTVDSDGGTDDPGMTLRDWFAGQALMSMIDVPQQITNDTGKLAAKHCYAIADAMIEERARRRSAV